MVVFDWKYQIHLCFTQASFHSIITSSLIIIYSLRPVSHLTVQTCKDITGKSTLYINGLGGCFVSKIWHHCKAFLHCMLWHSHRNMICMWEGKDLAWLKDQMKHDIKIVHSQKVTEEWWEGSCILSLTRVHTNLQVWERLRAYLCMSEVTEGNLE